MALWSHVIYRRHQQLRHCDDHVRYVINKGVTEWITVVINTRFRCVKGIVSDISDGMITVTISDGMITVTITHTPLCHHYRLHSVKATTDVISTILYCLKTSTDVISTILYCLKTSTDVISTILYCLKTSTDVISTILYYLKRLQTSSTQYSTVLNVYRRHQHNTLLC